MNNIDNKVEKWMEKEERELTEEEVDKNVRDAFKWNPDIIINMGMAVERKV